MWRPTARSPRRPRRARAGLLLLDAGLPDVDGFSLCRWIREQHPLLPIIIVTARDADIDIVVGLDAGADDYVTKPFSIGSCSPASAPTCALRAERSRSRPIEVGRLRVEPAAYLAQVDGEPVDLRPREFELLLALVRDAGRVVTREQLLGDVWDMHWDDVDEDTRHAHPRPAPQAARRHRHHHRSRSRLPTRGAMKRRITAAIVGVTAIVLLVLGIPLAIAVQIAVLQSEIVELQGESVRLSPRRRSRSTGPTWASSRRAAIPT